MPITTKVGSSNPPHGEVYSIQLYVIQFVGDLAVGLWFSKGPSVSSTSKTDRHDINEILLLKVAIHTITLTLTLEVRWGESCIQVKYFWMSFRNIPLHLVDENATKLYFIIFIFILVLSKPTKTERVNNQRKQHNKPGHKFWDSTQKCRCSFHISCHSDTECHHHGPGYRCQYSCCGTHCSLQTTYHHRHVSHCDTVVTRVTWWVPLVEQELLILPEYMSSHTDIF